MRKLINSNFILAVIAICHLKVQHKSQTTFLQLVLTKQSQPCSLTPPSLYLLLHFPWDSCLLHLARVLLLTVLLTPVCVPLPQIEGESLTTAWPPGVLNPEANFERCAVSRQHLTPECSGRSQPVIFSLYLCGVWPGSGLQPLQPERMLMGPPEVLWVLLLTICSCKVQKHSALTYNSHCLCLNMKCETSQNHCTSNFFC